MALRRSDLQPAFQIPGTHDFTVRGYGTTDTLDPLLRPRYLRGGHSLVAPGDLVYVRLRPRPDPRDGSPVGEVRAALLMVSGVERGDATLRLVQDFGPPGGAAPAAETGASERPAAAPAVKKRGRRPKIRARPGG